MSEVLDSRRSQSVREGYGEAENVRLKKLASASSEKIRSNRNCLKNEEECLRKDRRIGIIHKHKILERCGA